MKWTGGGWLFLAPQSVYHDKIEAENIRLSCLRCLSDESLAPSISREELLVQLCLVEQWLEQHKEVDRG